MGVVRRLVAVAMCLPLLFSCSEDEPSREPEASTSTSATSSPSPSPTGQAIPPAAQGTDEASAKAFVRFWFESLSSALVTGNFESMDQLTAATCQTCQGLRDQVTRVYQDGGRYETEGFRVERFLRLDYSRRSPRFGLRVREHPRSLFDRQGNLVDRQPGGRWPMEIELARDGGHWQVTRLDLV
ncbi:MAG TPA: DUF6318 family protein, partial [Intrasporangium sp.]|nr:DUF6318 family protein [Intrasporangium sp.]